MKRTKTILFLLLFSFVLTHTAFPHHHHLVQQAEEKHDHHHHDKDHSHEHDADHQEDHNVFTFTQIDHIFLNGKQLSIPIVLVALPVSQYSLTLYNIDYEEEYFERDNLHPPLITIPDCTFRGPPIV